MTSIFVSTLELPDPYNTADVGAWVEYGKRKVCLTLNTPGTLHRCRYEMAWLDVTEMYPWKGEPLYVSGQRRPPGGEWSRQSFTDAARKSMSAEILPVVSRYGFERWWLEVHRATKGQQIQSESESQIVEVEKIVTYHRRRVELGGLWSSGLLDLVPVEGVRVEMLDSGYDMRWARVDVAAKLLFGDDHLGWMTRDGKVVPHVE